MQIQFIVAVNNRPQFDRFTRQIHHVVKIPGGVTASVATVEAAASICKAYNHALRGARADLRIYAHQDTVILNPDLIGDLMRLFSSDERIGVVGLAGAKRMPPNGVWWESPHRIGGVLEVRAGLYIDQRQNGWFKEPDGDMEDVEVVDGVFMAIRGDIAWREDLFDGWHYYDASQCFEYRRAGYRVVVPPQKGAWILHETGSRANDPAFEHYRRIFLDTYMNVQRVRF